MLLKEKDKKLPGHKVGDFLAQNKILFTKKQE